MNPSKFSLLTSPTSLPSTSLASSDPPPTSLPQINAFTVNISRCLCTTLVLPLRHLCYLLAIVGIGIRVRQSTDLSLTTPEPDALSLSLSLSDLCKLLIASLIELATAAQIPSNAATYPGPQQRRRLPQRAWPPPSAQVAHRHAHALPFTACARACRHAHASCTVLELRETEKLGQVREEGEGFGLLQRWKGGGGAKNDVGGDEGDGGGSRWDHRGSGLLEGGSCPVALLFFTCIQYVCTCIHLYIIFFPTIIFVSKLCRL